MVVCFEKELIGGLKCGEEVTGRSLSIHQSEKIRCESKTCFATTSMNGLANPTVATNLPIPQHGVSNEPDNSILSLHDP